MRITYSYFLSKNDESGNFQIRKILFRNLGVLINILLEIFYNLFKNKHSDVVSQKKIENYLFLFFIQKLSTKSESFQIEKNLFRNLGKFWNKSF